MENKILFFVFFLLVITSCDLVSHTHYFNQAVKLEKKGDYKQAISLLNKAIEQKPNFRPALINRGVDKSLLEDYKGAIEDYNLILDFDSDNTMALLNIGNNYKRLSSYNKAIKYYSKALKTDGATSYKFEVRLRFNNEEDNDTDYYVNESEIYFERGLAYLLNAQYKKAIFDFQKAINSNYEIAKSYYFIGEAYYKNGNFNLAKENYLSSQKFGIENIDKELMRVDSLKKNCQLNYEMIGKEFIIPFYDTQNKMEIQYGNLNFERYKRIDVDESEISYIQEIIKSQIKNSKKSTDFIIQNICNYSVQIGGVYDKVEKVKKIYLNFLYGDNWFIKNNEKANQSEIRFLQVKDGGDNYFQGFINTKTNKLQIIYVNGEA